MRAEEHCDVLIIGAGLAGLALARQLLLNTDKRILLVDRRTEFPPAKQKVGEATVQLSAYYYARVLELEEHLMQEHYLKYNLRFYWRTPGLANDELPPRRIPSCNSLRLAQRDAEQGVPQLVHVGAASALNVRTASSSSAYVNS